MPAAGRGSWELDVRIAEHVHIGRLSAEGIFEAFNVDTYVSFNHAVGSPASGSFGRRKTTNDAQHGLP